MLEETSSLQLTLFAADSRAKTCHPLAKELALVVLTAAYGQSFVESLNSSDRRGSLLRTLPAVPGSGSTPSAKRWNSLDIRAYRSRLERGMSALNIREDESSLWPTLTAQSYGNNRGGAAGRVGKVRHSLESIASGPLSPRWCEWFMKFPEGWTEGVRLETRSCPSVRKLSGG